MAYRRKPVKVSRVLFVNKENLGERS